MVPTMTAAAAGPLRPRGAIAVTEAVMVTGAITVAITATGAIAAIGAIPAAAGAADRLAFPSSMAVLQAAAGMGPRRKPTAIPDRRATSVACRRPATACAAAV